MREESRGKWMMKGQRATIMTLHIPVVTVRLKTVNLHKHGMHNTIIPYNIYIGGMWVCSH